MCVGDLNKFHDSTREFAYLRVNEKGFYLGLVIYAEIYI